METAKVWYPVSEVQRWRQNSLCSKTHRINRLEIAADIIEESRIAGTVMRVYFVADAPGIIIRLEHDEYESPALSVSAAPYIVHDTATVEGGFDVTMSIPRGVAVGELIVELPNGWVYSETRPEPEENDLVWRIVVIIRSGDYA